MTKSQALQSFWESFSIPAIDEVSAYDLKDSELLSLGDTYITYEAALDELDEPVSLSASVWSRSTSWSRVEEITALISETIGYGGKLVKYNTGAFWVTKGTPFAQRTITEEDYDIRRMTININVEYLST